MAHLIRHSIQSALVALTAATLVPACGGGQPAAAPPPAAPAPPPAAAAAPPPAAPAPAPAPAAAEAPPAPPAEAEHPRPPHHHRYSVQLGEALSKVSLRPEQKTTTDAVLADLAKLEEAHRTLHEKLMVDLADGVGAGAIDKKKMDADVKAIVKAVQGDTAAVQTAMNKVHAALDPAQRKQLVDEMAALFAPPPGGPGMHGPGPGGPGGPEGMHHGGPGGPEAMHGGPGGGMHGPGPGPGGPGGMHGPGSDGGGHGHGPGMHGGHGPMMGKLMDDLGLTPEQREKLKAKFEAEMKTRMEGMKAHHAEMEKRMKAIGDAFVADKFDAKKAGVGEHRADMAKQMATQRIDFAASVLSILTPEQRQKFAEHVRSHAAGHED